MLFIVKVRVTSSKIMYFDTDKQTTTVWKNKGYFFLPSMNFE